MITYFEVYQDRFGDRITFQRKIDPMLFAMMLTLAADKEAKDEVYQLADEAQESGGREELLALPMVFLDTQPGRVRGALERKGFWATEWEEGSHGFAFTGFENACKEKLRKIEARIMNDGWGW